MSRVEDSHNYAIAVYNGESSLVGRGVDSLDPWRKWQLSELWRDMSARNMLGFYCIDTLTE